MSVPFAPATPLESQVHAGDRDGTLAWLRPLTVAERGSHRASVARMVSLMQESRWRTLRDPGPHWGAVATEEQVHAGSVAALLCCRAEDIGPVGCEPGLVLELLREFELPCLPQLADALLGARAFNITTVQALIGAGVIPRPDSDAYALGLIALPGFRLRGEAFAAYFEQDPGLAQATLRMFEVEGNADTSLASTDKYNRADNTWSHHLRTLCADGRLDRATLLDRTLSALQRDWPQYRSGWFSGFHADLEPTLQELQANAGRYLSLCHSRIPPTVTLALGALGKLEPGGALEPEALLSALAPVFANGNKGQVEAALKLLDRAVARVPALEEMACLMIVSGLVHEAPALQARLLARLAKTALPASTKAALRRHLPGMAASNRGALQALLGDPVPEAATEPVVGSPAPGRRAHPLDPGRVVPPVADLDALVQAIAHAFENDGDVDGFERAASALVAAAPIHAADHARFGPVLKRAAKMRKPLPAELARLLVFVLGGGRLPGVAAIDQGGQSSQMHAGLIRRTDAWMDLAALGAGAMPLSAPSHRRGFLDPAVLVERAAQHQAHGVRSGAIDEVAALLRLAGPGTDADRARARALADTPFVHALRYALGEPLAPGVPLALACAASRIRHPRADDATVHALFGDVGPDGSLAARLAWDVSHWTSSQRDALVFHELLVHAGHRAPEVGDLLAVARHPPPAVRQAWGSYRQVSLAGIEPGVVAWSATVLPSDLEAFFAEGSRAIGNNLDWWQAQWQDRAYLEPLLDETVASGPMAMLLLACGLAGKDPGQSALAADALVRMTAEGRLDAPLLAATLQRLLASSLVKPARIRRSLEAAMRIDPTLAPVLADLLCDALPLACSPPPRDIARLLELLHEILLSTGRGLPANAARGIAAWNLGGSGKALQKKLAALAT